MYQVYQLGGNASITLNLLSFGPERKVKCSIIGISLMNVFNTKKYSQGRKTCNNEVCVNGSTSNKFEVRHVNTNKFEVDYHEK
jgi:hypothetical protein